MDGVVNLRYCLRYWLRIRDPPLGLMALFLVLTLRSPLWGQLHLEAQTMRPLRIHPGPCLLSRRSRICMSGTLRSQHRHVCSLVTRRSNSDPPNSCRRVEESNSSQDARQTLELRTVVEPSKGGGEIKKNVVKVLSTTRPVKVKDLL